MEKILVILQLVTYILIIRNKLFTLYAMKNMYFDKNIKYNYPYFYLSIF